MKQELEDLLSEVTSYTALSYHLYKPKELYYDGYALFSEMLTKTIKHYEKIDKALNKYSSDYDRDEHMVRLREHLFWHVDKKLNELISPNG